MRLDETEQSDNIEDRRGEPGGGFGGGGFGLPLGGGGLGIGTIVILGLIGWALGIDPRLLIGGAEIFSGSHQTQYQQPAPPSQARRTGKPSDDIGRFVSTVLGNLDREWSDIFRQDGRTYRKPALVLYRNATAAACGGMVHGAMGPFYCEEDQKIYLDESILREIESRFHGCDGDLCQFAQAYVIAHPVGHHVQNLLGILSKVRQRQKADSTDADRLQVRLELQADCLAGVWLKHENDGLQKDGKPPVVAVDDDTAAALQMVSAVGGDTLHASGRV